MEGYVEFVASRIIKVGKHTHYLARGHDFLGRHEMHFDSSA